MDNVIYLEIYLTKPWRYEPLPIVENSKLPVVLRVMDYPLSGTKADVYTVDDKGQYRHDPVQATIADNEIRFIPSAGLFVPGKNKMQIQTDTGDIYSAEIPATVTPDFSNGGSTPAAEEVRPLAERAEAAAATAESIMDNLPTDYKELSAVVEYITEKSKNLYFSDMVPFTFNSNGSFTSAAGSQTAVIPINDPGGTYTISKIYSSRYRVGYTSQYPAVGVIGRGYHSALNNPIVDDRQADTITTDADAKYIVVMYASSTDTNADEIRRSIQVEAGSKATAFVPPATASDTIARQTVSTLDGNAVVARDGISSAMPADWDKDIHGVTKPGSYVFTRTGGYSNLPKAGAGMLIVNNARSTTNVDRIMHTAVYDDGSVWVESRIGSAWSGWAKVNTGASSVIINESDVAWTSGKAINANELAATTSFGSVESTGLFKLSENIDCAAYAGGALGITNPIARITIKTPRLGMMFYDADGNKISGWMAYPAKSYEGKDLPSGYNVDCIRIPPNAASFRAIWHLDAAAVGVTQPWYCRMTKSSYLPKVSNQHRFYVVRDNSNGLNDPLPPLEYGAADKVSMPQGLIEPIKHLCVLALPDSYDPDGAPTPVIMLCHGNAGWLTGGTWYWHGGLTEEDEAFERWLNAMASAGYAVFDVNSTTEAASADDYGNLKLQDAYYQAWEYIKANYNVEDQLNLYSMSLGTYTATIFTMMRKGLVKCCYHAAPRIDFDTTERTGTFPGFGLPTTLDNWRQDLRMRPFDIAKQIKMYNGEERLEIGYPPSMWLMEDYSSGNKAKYWAATLRVITALRNGGAYVNAHIRSGSSHAGAGFALDMMTDEVVAFFNRYNTHPSKSGTAAIPELTLSGDFDEDK